MNLQRRTDGWWIVDTPQDVDEMGPYDTKADAQDDLRGVERFFKYEVNRRVRPAETTA